MLKVEDCKNIKVLYVEDDTVAAKSMMNIFKKFFPNILYAENGLEGLEYIKAQELDLIITDINMPKMDGMEMISKMKDLGKDIYTIMLTAYSDNNTFLESVKLGVKGYAIKPLVVMQFLETIESAIHTINSLKQSDILDHYKHIMVSKTDPAGKIFYVNDKFCEVTGFSKDELIGNTHNMMKYSDMERDTYLDLWQTISKRNIWVGQLKNIKKDKSMYRVDTTICPIVDNSGEIIEYIGLQNDITHIVNPLTQLQDLLYNSKKPFLAMLDIENYETLKHIYDKDILDEMLEMFSMMLYTYLPSTLPVQQIINLNNGKFALFQELDTSTIDIEDITLALKELQYNIAQGIIIVNDFDFDLSVVISFSDQKDKIYENVNYGFNVLQKENKLIICANDLTALAKQRATKNTKVIKMIQTAINNDNIISYFQPITNNKTMKVEKYESLVRLIDEDGKVLSPYFFLDIAKESGYYSKITNIVLTNSFKALMKTTKEISMNLSAIDIENPHIRSKIMTLLEQHKDDTHRVVFELLEDEKVKDFNVVKDFITHAKSYGVKIAIDDFGAGVSNFERLLDYQPDILKIDACLIKNIDQDKYSKDVVETIQLFAWKQDIKTVAEFVETQEILKTVKDIGINYTQGYLLGKPDLLENLQ